MTLELDGVIRVGAFEVALAIAVADGETVALVGPNGAGKSTVLRAVAGLEQLASGRLVVDGDVWDDPSSGGLVPPHRRSVGVMFQHYLLFEHLSALENVAFGLRARGVPRADARDEAARLLTDLGVAAVASRAPSELSGGQAQRVALARALVGSPRVLLLDEPLAALDAGARASVRRELRGRLAAATGARLLVTHDPVDAHELADRVVVLEAGAVTQTGAFDDLAAAPRSTYVAELMGTNVLAGRIDGSTFVVSDGRTLQVAAVHGLPDGPAVVAIRPMAIALHRARPEGSPRNVWSTTVADVDRFHERVRVRLGPELPLVAEITEAGLAALGVRAGDEVWASVKASEITVVADS